MRKQSRRVIFSGISGVVIGGALIVLTLSYIGSTSEEKDSQVIKLSESSPEVIQETLETSTNTPTPSVTPVIKKDDNSLIFEKGEFKYILPNHYRIADGIIALDQKNSVSSAVLTLTQGSSDKENEYVSLINKLQEDRATTEAPQFLPGKTIAIYPSGTTSENYDAKMASVKKEINTQNGLKGIRYYKVEGLFPYDVTYLNFPDGRKIVVQMNYASEEPFFDETAYMTVVDSIKPKN